MLLCLFCQVLSSGLLLIFSSILLTLFGTPCAHLGGMLVENMTSKKVAVLFLMGFPTCMRSCNSKSSP